MAKTLVVTCDGCGEVADGIAGRWEITARWVIREERPAIDIDADLCSRCKNLVEIIVSSAASGTRPESVHLAVEPAATPLRSIGAC